MDDIRNKTPKISIVLPVYNGERFLRQAIDSVIGQIYCDWELIIVNDCSTDSSRSIIEEYSNKDNRIRIVDNQENLKLPRSLNVGFRSARGEYFTWTSDDNILKPQMLEALVEELEADDSCGMVYSDYTDIDEDGNPFREMTLSEPDRLGIEGNICGPSFLYRKEIALQVGEYNPDLFLAEDFDYWLRISGVTRIKHIPRDLYFYRHHDKSLSSTKTIQGSRQTVRAILNNIWTICARAKIEEDRSQLYKTIYQYAGRGEEIRKLEDRIKEAYKYTEIVKRERKKSQIKIMIKTRLKRIFLWRK